MPDDARSIWLLVSAHVWAKMLSNGKRPLALIKGREYKSQVSKRKLRPVRTWSTWATYGQNQQAAFFATSRYYAVHDHCAFTKQALNIRE